MMGTTLISIDTPVIKGTSGVLALTAKQADLTEESSCIRCGKCVGACPMFLRPYKLNSSVVRRDFETFEKIMDYLVLSAVHVLMFVLLNVT